MAERDLTLHTVRILSGPREGAPAYVVGDPTGLDVGYLEPKTGHLRPSPGRGRLRHRRVCVRGRDGYDFDGFKHARCAGCGAEVARQHETRPEGGRAQVTRVEACPGCGHPLP